MVDLIETDRLILRPLRDSDLVPLSAAVNNRRITCNTASIPWPYRLDDAFALQRLAATCNAGSRRFIMTAKGGDDIPLGVVGLDADRLQSQAEIGYWLAEQMWGRGFGLEAAAAVTGYGFAKLGHERLVAAYRHGNEGSRRILDRLGFRVIGHTMIYSRGAGAYTPAARLELTRREWLWLRQGRG